MLPWQRELRHTSTYGVQKRQMSKVESLKTSWKRTISLPPPQWSGVTVVNITHGAIPEALDCEGTTSFAPRMRWSAAGNRGHVQHRTLVLRMMITYQFASVFVDGGLQKAQRESRNGTDLRC